MTEEGRMTEEPLPPPQGLGYIGDSLMALGYGQPAVVEAMETERAMARVAMAALPTALPAALAEVERRQQLGMTRRAAYESVGDDLVTRRWQP